MWQEIPTCISCTLLGSPVLLLNWPEMAGKFQSSAPTLSGARAKPNIDKSISLRDLMDGSSEPEWHCPASLAASLPGRTGPWPQTYLPSTPKAVLNSSSF